MATVARPFKIEYLKRENIFTFRIPYFVLIYLTISLIIYIALTAKIIYAEYKINNLKKLISIKEEEYKRLLFEYEKLSAKERITTIAKNKLGMITPSDVELLSVNEKKVYQKDTTQRRIK